MNKNKSSCIFVPLLGFLFFGLGAGAFAADKQIDLKDLGFSDSVIKADDGRQAMLDERTHKLKTHEIMGPITWALMTATVLTAPDHNKASTAHQALGIATAASYFTAAYLSLSAPNDPQAGEAATNLKIHKTLAWVHFPLMVLTPIVGMMAQRQFNRGESLHGLASHKGQIASALYVTYSASFAVMLF